MTAAPENFLADNQVGLSRELDRLYARLTGATAVVAHETPPAFNLDRICAAFGLTAFERDLLLLCAGCELEGRFADACAAAHGNPRAIWPTVGLAFAKLPSPHWSAIAPEGPLRFWRIIATGNENGLVRSELRLSERALLFLMDLDGLDERLLAVLHPVRHRTVLNTAPFRECAAKVVEFWGPPADRSLRVFPVTRRSSDFLSVAEETNRAAAAPCFTMKASGIPSAAGERTEMARVWAREAVLTGAILFVETAGIDSVEATRLSSFLDQTPGRIAVEVRDGAELGSIEGLRIPIRPATIAERKQIWVDELGDAALSLNGSLDRLADYFDLDAAGIRRTATTTTTITAQQPGSDIAEVAWAQCRIQARKPFEGLGRRVPPRAGWDDLVLPELQKDALRQIVAQVRQRSIVNNDWGFGDRFSNGLGVTALFAGASGTGKTMAAEVVARELDLDLVQIDLSGVMSKYIGETEKNLRRIFEAAEAGGAVLLFDEADALFGKRSEVKDSHDRYANLEISYLLQRMEAYGGLAILTTNIKHALDSAFLRRIRFAVQFPFPGPEERTRIWQKVFPARTPLGALDFDRISQLNIAGGTIRNIAIHAAFLAADESSSIGMEHIRRAAKVEYAKLDRPLTPSEIGGWI